MDFSGRVALITGGGRGIGKATALALAHRGADIIVNYLQNAKAAAETASAGISPRTRPDKFVPSTKKKTPATGAETAPAA